MLSLEDTRTIAVRADTLAAEAVRSTERISRDIGELRRENAEMRRENAEQHADGRRANSDGLRRVHERLDGFRNLIDQRDDKLLAAVRLEVATAVSTVRQEALSAAKPGESANKNLISLERWISRGLIVFLASAVGAWILKNLGQFGR